MSTMAHLIPKKSSQSYFHFPTFEDHLWCYLFVECQIVEYQIVVRWNVEFWDNVKMSNDKLSTCQIIRLFSYPHDMWPKWHDDKLKCQKFDTHLHFDTLSFDILSFDNLTFWHFVIWHFVVQQFDILTLCHLTFCRSTLCRSTICHSATYHSTSKRSIPFMKRPHSFYVHSTCVKVSASGPKVLHYVHRKMRFLTKVCLSIK
jgi:hypothetical protein